VNSNVDPQALHAAMAMLAFMPIFFVIFTAIFIIPLWVIWKKAGFSPWLSLLMIIPMVNIIMLYVLAFSEWKVAPVPQMPYGQPPYPQQPPYPRV
jgi:hypothetical protein